MSQKSPGSKKSRIVSIFITFAILFIIVFALGVIIGNGLGGSDEPEVQIANEESTIEYGIPEEEPEPEVEEEVVVEQTEETKKEEVKRPAVEKPKAKEEEKIRAEEQVDGTYHIQTRAPTPKPVKATEKPKTETKEEVLEELKEAKLEKTSPKKPETKVDTGSMPKIDPSGSYTVQLGAFQNQAQANQLANSLKSKGYPAFVKQYTASDKKTWYRVRVGTFTTKQQATTYGNGLKKQQPQVKSVFITTNN